ncbi:imidazole glycerol phosphate synthase [Thalassospira profundimaris]|nr:imidazole glycerol phosphate synthase [Thalassospira profundimaris]
MIVIVDYGVGNLNSVRNMLLHVGAKAKVSSEPADIEGAQKLILPGVGHFDHGMRKLRSSGLIDPLECAVLKHKVPILGICLGAQILGRKSEEGTELGLGWLNMECRKFPDTMGLPVPHMSWNSLVHRRKSRFFSLELQDSRYYFVHSYFMHCDSEDDVVSDCDYGVRFSAVVGRDNITGMQFHPEKSLKYGMAVMKNFNENY